MIDHTIGTKFLTRTAHPRTCTVTDILKTYNSVGTLVATRYEAEYTFMGRILLMRDVVATTIAMGKIDQ